MIDGVNVPLLVPVCTVHDAVCVAPATAKGSTVETVCVAFEPTNEKPEGKVSVTDGDGAFRSPWFFTVAVNVNCVLPARSDGAASPFSRAVRPPEESFSPFAPEPSGAVIETRTSPDFGWQVSHTCPLIDCGELLGKTTSEIRVTAHYTYRIPLEAHWTLRLEKDHYELVVPQLSKPRGVLSSFDGTALEIGDDFFRPGKITAKVGETVTWNFTGSRPHSVTVANGPRGFSSVYWGSTSGSYSVTPKVRGSPGWPTKRPVLPGAAVSRS